MSKLKKLIYALCDPRSERVLMRARDVAANAKADMVVSHPDVGVAQLVRRELYSPACQVAHRSAMEHINERVHRSAIQKRGRAWHNLWQSRRSLSAPKSARRHS